VILRFQHRFQAGSLCELEIDLDAVRDNSLVPHFRWKGTKHRQRKLITWISAVWREVASRTGVPIVWCFVYPNRSTESWVFEPGEKPRRIAKADEPSQNPASAIIIAATAKFATQSEKEPEQC
jgi:hypothetical protein